MELDERSRKVLFAVIQCYVNSPGPVGSRVVTKKFSFGLSPATIRNIMSDLEEMGLLSQPHTSAGRVPTDSGYRYYVDSVKTEQKMVSDDFIQALNRKWDILKRDVNSFLIEASKMLSSLSHYIGITIPPTTGSTTLNRIEMIKFRGNQVGVILFTDEGIIQNRMISLERDIPQRDLSRITEYINSTFAGRTLNEIRDTISVQMEEERMLCDSLITDAMKICSDAISIAPENIYISGLSEMLALPDFSDINRIKELLRTIEDKHIMIGLLNEISDSEGTQVFIGSENPLSEMRKFSLVASTYREGDRPIGAIGIIGPTRMDYERAISIVDLTAAYITDILSYR